MDARGRGRAEERSDGGRGRVQATVEGGSRTTGRGDGGEGDGARAARKVEGRREEILYAVRAVVVETLKLRSLYGLRGDLSALKVICENIERQTSPREGREMRTSKDPPQLVVALLN